MIDKDFIFRYNELVSIVMYQQLQLKKENFIDNWLAIMTMVGSFYLTTIHSKPKCINLSDLYI